MVTVLRTVVVTDWVDFNCPNARCGRYLVTVERGSRIKRGYCRGCGMKFNDQVAGT